MKRSAFLRLCLCMCLCTCLLFSACGTSSPEESDLSSESSDVALIPALEDPHAATVRAYLDELLAADWETEESTIQWLTAEQAETIRESVKKLKTPILTEEDLFRISERAAYAVAAAMEKPCMLEAPACGLLAAVTWSPDNPFHTYEDCYRALLGYTLYLFTPPDYVFRETEVGYRLEVFYGELCLYLPLKGKYSTRSEALALLQEGKNGVELELSGLGSDPHPLDFYRCNAPYLMRGEGDGLTFDLFELVLQGNIALPESFFLSYAEAYVQRLINRLSSGAISSLLGRYESYQFPDGTWGTVYVLLAPEEAREIRQLVEQFSGPVLTEETVRKLEFSMFLNVMSHDPFLYPGIDGQPDSVMWGDGNDPALLAKNVTSFLIDLFTPSAYRYESLPAFSGVCYALRPSAWNYEDPEAALKDFSEGFTRMVLVDGGVPYFVDRDGNAEPPAEEPGHATTY